MIAEDVQAVVDQLKLINEKLEAIAVALRLSPAPKVEEPITPEDLRPPRDIYSPNQKL